MCNWQHVIDDVTLTKPPSFVIKPSFDATFKDTHHKLQSDCVWNMSQRGGVMVLLISRSISRLCLKCFITFTACLQCLDTVGLAPRRTWPAKNWVMRCWRGYLSGARCKWFAHGPADATATPSPLASLRSRMVCLSGAGLPRLSWKKGRQIGVMFGTIVL